MEIKKFYSFELKSSTETGEEIILKGGINLNDIFHYVIEDGTLFIFTKYLKTDLKPLMLPNAKGKLEKQIRNVEDFFTIRISEKGDIERFIDYMKSISI